jgi:hypothetical protein
MKQQIIKLLNRHTYSTKEVQAWFLSNLLKTVDDNMPEEFKEFVKSQTVDDDKLATMIKESPRGLLDVFDEHEIYINIVYEVGFVWHLGHPYSEGGASVPYNTRKKAEYKAIFKAIEILDNKLKPKKDEKTKEKS